MLAPVLLIELGGLVLDPIAGTTLTMRFQHAIQSPKASLPKPPLPNNFILQALGREPHFHDRDVAHGFSKPP